MTMKFGRQQSSAETERAISPVFAVALLILIALGFTAGLQTAGSQLIDGIEQPPGAEIKIEPGQDGVHMLVMRTRNADALNILVDGETVTDQNGEQLLTPSAGSSTMLDWSGSASGNRIDISSEVTPGESVITVVAVDYPDNTATAFSYEVPDV